MRDLVIAIPAWGDSYIDLATRFTIPASIAALKEAGCGARFLIHTDRQTRFIKATAGFTTEYRQVPRGLGKRKDWDRFIACHKEAIEATPAGSILALLNADIVVSRETYGFVQSTLASGDKKVIGSFGIRADVDRGDPPIGVDRDTLGKWIWANRHPITSELIWGKGRSGLPTQLYFDDGQGNVTTHGFYMVPMFILKDERRVSFDNTIDDDLFKNYRDDEVHYMTKGEAIFAELSRNAKRHTVKAPLSIPGMIAFGRGRVLKSQMRNFRQPIRVTGKEPGPNPVIEQICRGIGSGR